jgi:hypothetical protein
MWGLIRETSASHHRHRSRGRSQPPPGRARACALGWRGVGGADKLEHGFAEVLCDAFHPYQFV